MCRLIPSFLDAVANKVVVFTYSVERLPLGT